jgi:prepilin-type N-terminal cleavage/methylation domain-containing protein
MGKRSSTSRAASKITSSGFTLVEVIGVLAVIAIVACMAIPVVVKQVDQAAWTKEYNDLSAISNALVLQSIRGHTIPDSSAGATGWGQAAGTWLDRPVSQITNNLRHFQRSFRVDPNSGLTLPYNQNNNGNLGQLNAPTNSRVIIVSTLAGTDPPYPSGSTLSGTDFQAIWDTPERAPPQTSLKWTMSGEDICIQRINLEPTFHRLILVNRDTNGAATFSINSATPTAVPNNGTNWSAYYFDGSIVSLCDAQGINIMTRYVLTRDISFVFESGSWLGQVTGEPPSNAQAMGFSLSANVLLQTVPIDSQWLAVAALQNLTSILNEYAAWANECPMHFSWHGNASPTLTIEYQWLTNNIGNLDISTGPTGLLSKGGP